MPPVESLGPASLFALLLIISLSLAATGALKPANYPSGRKRLDYGFLPVF